MITSQRKQIFQPRLGGFLHVAVSSRGFSPGERIPPIESIYRWIQPAQSADWWSIGAISRFLESEQCPIDREGLIVVPYPACSCCGYPANIYGGATVSLVKPHRDPLQRQYRCEKHRDRNPCAIEGCKRTTSAGGCFESDRWLCGEHWRQFVPPHSALRRAYHRFFREAKRHGWDDQLKRRFWRFWGGVIRRARRLHGDDVFDLTEINKLFGWTDE